MNVVIFSAYAINTPHFETELELVQRHVDQGDSVTVLVCGGELEACDPNPHHDRPRCVKCVARRRAGLRLVPRKVRVESYYRVTAEDLRELGHLPGAFDDLEQLKELRIGHFDIGYGVVSSLVSLTREPDVDLQKNARLVRALLRSAWTVYRSMQRYLADHPVDRVYVFNGRFAALRAVLRACREAEVDCFTHERGHSPQHYSLCRNTTPHDRQYTGAKMREAWHAAGADSDRRAVARQWYQRRADGNNDLSFVKRQHAARLPRDWDPRKRNIAVYVSSEDEFVGIGASWKNPLYASQAAGLQAIVQSLRSDPQDVHLYLRVHPNLANIDNQQTRALAALGSPQLTTIPPHDPVSTYALMRHCDKVLSFGSTTGIEAVYWGRPSVLAGQSFYRELCATYNPACHEELMRLLRSDLEPKDIEPTLMYAYYWATYGQPFEHFTSDGWYRGRFKGRRIGPSTLDGAKIALLSLLYPGRIARRVRKLAGRGLLSAVGFRTRYPQT